MSSTESSPSSASWASAFQRPTAAPAAADTALLDTLSEREFRAGYAEVAKYGLLGDAEFFAWLEANWADVFSGAPARGNLVAPREYAILRSVRMKAEIVARDERETGERALLNLGHTFGHALEAACGFDAARLIHGEAVSIGMVLAHDFSVSEGLAPASDAERCRAHLKAADLPVGIADIPGPQITADELMRHIAQDKKVKRGRLTFILTRGIGQAFVADDVSPEKVRAFLEARVRH